jgi:hypothetical protein
MGEATSKGAVIAIPVVTTREVMARHLNSNMVVISSKGATVHQEVHDPVDSKEARRSSMVEDSNRIVVAFSNNGVPVVLVRQEVHDPVDLVVHGEALVASVVHGVDQEDLEVHGKSF